jgi:very-short-patch-repair endonuclease
MKIYYKPKLKQYARDLRNKSTLSEVLLWTYLKKKQMKGYAFHRQKPIDNYIVDFYCSKLKLIIEVDGQSHDENKFEYDKKRQERLEALGLHVFRVSDLDVKGNMEGVLTGIRNWIEEYEKGEFYDKGKK